MTSSLFESQIPLARPWLDEAEVQAVRQVMLSGWVSQGPMVERFEQTLASRLGAAHGVATNAATSALHLALLVAGIQPGDEVICPATTCMATANAICHANAVPAFADVDAQTFNLSPWDVAQRITPRTRALMVVHQIGLPADILALEEFSRRHGLVLIEDGATALGAKYHEQYVGSRGNPTCFSFHPRKIITTGEGGMLLLNCGELAEQARCLRSTGASVSDLVRHAARGVVQQTYASVGYNYRLTDMQAAMGLVQLDRLTEMLASRRAQAEFYGRLFAEVDEIQTPFVPDWAEPCWSSYCVTLRGATERARDEVLHALAREGISCRRGIPALYREPYFAARMPGMYLEGSEQVARSTLFLPIFPGLSEGDQTRVVEALKRALAADSTRKPVRC